MAISSSSSISTSSSVVLDHDQLLIENNKDTKSRLEKIKETLFWCGKLTSNNLFRKQLLEDLKTNIMSDLLVDTTKGPSSNKQVPMQEEEELPINIICFDGGGSKGKLWLHFDDWFFFAPSFYPNIRWFISLDLWF